MERSRYISKGDLHNSHISSGAVLAAQSYPQCHYGEGSSRCGEEDGGEHLGGNCSLSQI